MPGPFTVHIGPPNAVHSYSIAGTDLLPKGKRGYIRRSKEAQESTPAFPKTARWKLSGAIGLSREREDGFLGHDWSNLDTRNEDLLTSLGAVSTVTVSGSDPISSASAALGGFALGGAALGGGTSVATAQNISHIREYAGYLFLLRGAFVSMVSPVTWTLAATTAFATVTRGAANWYGKLRIGMGAQKALQTVTGITSSSFTTADQQISSSDVLANELAVTNDRLWMVRADPAGTNENRLRFTADDFTSGSTGFFVGDPKVNATSIGILGGYTIAGSETSDFGFTENGLPFALNRALQDARSTENGRKKATMFGWQYSISILGLYASRVGVTNPVGIGTESMWGFEGFDGRPVAVTAWRESLLCAYEDSAGTTWRILRGTFNANTDSTGELSWYPFAQRTAGAVRDISAASSQATGSLPAVCWGEGPNTLAYMKQGRGGRDITDTSYPFSTAGGVWYGSAMMRAQHLRKTIRWARVFTENMASGNTWQFAVSFDGGAYTDVGAAITTAGAQKVVPSTLSSAPTGFSPKPRLTQVAGAGSSSATPPQLRGYLELGYDERPDRVLECAFVLHLGSKAELTRLELLVDPDDTTGRQPVEIHLPEDSTVRFGYVTAVEEQDLTDAGVIGAAVTVILADAA